MRASLLAKATTAAFLCTLAKSARNHPPSGVSLLESVGRTALAPWIRSLRPFTASGTASPKRHTNTDLCHRQWLLERKAATPRQSHSALVQFGQFEMQRPKTSFFFRFR